MASPAQAIGLTFDWSFTATGNNGTGAQLGLVSGRISGVLDNATTSSGLTAIVLDTPDDQNEGLTFNFVDTGDITVVAGMVTSSSLFFRGSNLSSNDILELNSFVALYAIGNPSSYSLDTFASPSGTTFSAATPVPFDFDPSFGVVALGGIWAGRKVIKKIKTSKKSV